MANFFRIPYLENGLSIYLSHYQKQCIKWPKEALPKWLQMPYTRGRTFSFLPESASNFLSPFFVTTLDNN